MSFSQLYFCQYFFFSKPKSQMCLPMGSTLRTRITFPPESVEKTHITQLSNVSQRSINPLYANTNAKLLQSCPTLCDPIDGSPPGSAVPGILQARTLEWVAFSFSNAWKRKVKVKSLSRVQLLATPWTAAYQAPLFMDFPGKSTGVGCHCLLPNPL